MSIQQTLIRSLGDEPVPPPPILGMVLTSGLYPVLAEGDAISASAGLMAASTYIFFDNAIEQVYARAGLQSTALNATIVYTLYSNWPVEDVYSRAGFQAGTLTSTIVFTNYTNWPVENAYARAGLQSATLTTVIAFINNAMQPEDIYARAGIQNGTLTVA